MPYARGNAICLVGLDGHSVTVEVHIGRGKSEVVLAGLADTALAESKVRIRSAFENSELDWPDYHTVINLVPASLPKSGSVCDLAIAVTLAAAHCQLPSELLPTTVLLGELGLDGRLRPASGVLPAVLAAAGNGMTSAIVPRANLAEAGLVSTVRAYGAEHLRDVVAFLRGEAKLWEPSDEAAPPAVTSAPATDLTDVVGQAGARRALEVAAAGRHHMLMVGPPGSGKTMLAERMPSILPPLDDAAALEVTALSSVRAAPEAPVTELVRHPPFSAPHHSATMPAMVGGGSNQLRPGAISQAHHGVLFLDECPEMRRDVLDALRQPLESGEILVTRSRASARFPAHIQLVLAANPCPCAAASLRSCVCSPNTRNRYLRRLSGPLLDRVDIRLEVAPVPVSALLTSEMNESSEVVAQRVADARQAATSRWSEAGHAWLANGDVPGSVLRSRRWRLPPRVTATADHLMSTGQLTARGYDRVLRLAWSIADLAGRTAPTPDDLAAATGLRIGHRLPG